MQFYPPPNLLYLFIRVQIIMKTETSWVNFLSYEATLKYYWKSDSCEFILNFHTS